MMKGSQLVELQAQLGSLQCNLQAQVAIAPAVGLASCLSQSGSPSILELLYTRLP